MKSKDLVKKLLPICVALVLIALIAILITVLTKAKVNPTLSSGKGEQSYFVYNNDGKIIKYTNQEAYEKLKSEYGLSVVVDNIDKDLLADEIASLTTEQIKKEAIDTIFSTTIEKYIENNKFEDSEVEEKLNEGVSAFIKNAFSRYGISVAKDDLKIVKDGENYTVEVKTGTDFYDYVALNAARFSYAYKKLTDKYEEELVEYKKYLEDKAAYEASEADDKVAPTAPSMTISDSKYSDLWDEDHVDAYWAIVIPYSSYSEAETALLQHGLVVKSLTVLQGEVESTKSIWLHYGRVTDEQKDAFESEDIDGYNIITKNDYYKDLVNEYYKDNTKNTSANPDQYGAYVLSDDEIKQAIVNLYNHYYGWEIKSMPVASDEVALKTESKFYYTAADLTKLSLLSSVTGNKFNEFKADETNFRKLYSEAVSSSSYKVYWILGKEDTTQWEDLKDTNTILEFMNANKADLVEAATTATIVNNSLDELRIEKGLKFYDSVLEDSYKSTYSSTTLKINRKSSKNVVYTCNGKDITVDQLFDTISTKYAVAVALEQYQYSWMLLYASKADGTKFNKYFDYQAFLDGKKLSKCIYDNDDAKKLWDSITGTDGTITNIKNSFASGGYATYGYDASYGWKNFLRDFFSRYYGVQIKDNDDLAVYLIYQQIVNDYTKYVSDASNLDWTIFQADYISQLNSYINSNGFHLLICKKDADGNIIKPEEWTDEEKLAASELYNKVIELAKVLEKDELDELLSGINSAFTSTSKYPIKFEDGSYIKDNLLSSKNDKKFKYTYVYSNNTTTYSEYEIDLAEYKTLGLQVTYEELTTTAGVMVKEFEAAVREMWNANINNMLESEKGLVEEIELHEAKIETEFGYHLYVNTSHDLSAYLNDKKVVGLPSLDYVALYQYEANHASDDDYVKVVDLVADYQEAVQLGKDTTKAKAAVVKAMAKVDYLDVNDTNVEDFINNTLYGYTNIQELIDKSTSSTKKIDTDDIVNNTTVQSQITSWVKTIYDEFTGSYYYQLIVLQEAQKNASYISLEGKGDNSAITDLLNAYVESYYSYLTYNTTDKKLCEKLLGAFELTTQLADTLDKTTNDAMKALAKDLFNALSAEDKAELQEAYDKAKFN